MSTKTQPVGHRALSKVIQGIWLLTGILEALLGLRFLLKLLAANPNAGFAAFVYQITAPFLGPFQNLFSTPQAAGAVIELSTLVAMVVYALAAQLLIRLILLIFKS